MDVSVRAVSACPFVCSFLFRLSERETEPKRKDPAGHSQPYPSTVETGLRNSLRSNSPRLIPSLVAAVLNGLFIKWRKKVFSLVEGQGVGLLSKIIPNVFWASASHIPLPILHVGFVPCFSFQ